MPSQAHVLIYITDLQDDHLVKRETLASPHNQKQGRQLATMCCSQSMNAHSKLQRLN